MSPAGALAAGVSLAALLAGSNAAGGVAASRAARPSCGSPGYTYAGIAGRGRAYGVAARITTLSSPRVESGHVAAWVGVGGRGLGPGRSDAWIQVGLSAFPGQVTTGLYYEVARPGGGAQYYPLGDALRYGAPHRVAVLEVARRPGSWRIWLDGRPVSPTIQLPGSHGRWAPIATAESWGGGVTVCNRYAFEFDRVFAASAPGGGWSEIGESYTFQDPGYRAVRRSAATFVATAA